MKKNRIVFILLLLFSSSLAWAQLALQSHLPTANAQSITTDANITMTFDANIDEVTLDGTTVVVSGSQTGLIAGTFSGGGTTTITFNPTNDFFAGEQVYVTITQQLLNETGGASLATPYHFTFTTASAVSPEDPSEFSAFTISSSADGVRGVYAADIDGDGDMDVLSASQNNDRITWFENDGNGLNPTFTTHDISTTADLASSVYAADIDGDGDMDVLSASRNDDRIAWYENDGNESFTTHDISTTADLASSVYAADIDGDGDMDVLSASQSDDRIAWYENDGNESFITHDISTTADGANSVYAADVDGDGDMDVLSASQSDDRIAWYENDGNESFTTHDISTTADYARSVYAADIDGDGDMDVLSASFVDDRIAWYENDGNESFTTHDISTTAAEPTSVYAADIDGDGDMDVLSASFFDDRIAWYENDGNESFTTHDISTTADGANSVYAADVDGDGDMDVLSASQSDDRIAWYKNASITEIVSTVPTANAQSITTDANITMTFDANIDGTTLDGTTVVVSGSQTGLIAGTFSGGGTTTITFNPTNDFFAGEQVYVTITQQLLNETGGALATPYHFTFTTASAVSPEDPSEFSAFTISSSADGARGVYAADIDGDGDMDVLSASQTDDRITWFENDGNGLNPTFTTHDISTTADGAYSVHAVDVDGDGDMDVLSASFFDDRIAWYENDGNESFTTHDISTTADGAFDIYAADIDGDGDMDVLSASIGDDRIAWYENDGNESFITHDISTTADGARGVYAADIDGDGDMDVLSASQQDNRIVWYENDGSESFTTHDISTTAADPTSVYAADIDGDGDMDVLSASFVDDRIAWYENDGNESFTTHDISTTADGASSVHTADVDGDGDMDVLSASFADDRIAWYENDGNESFTTHDISTTADGAGSVYTADIDGDGDLDVISASYYSDRIDWYKNASITEIVSTVPTATAQSITSDANITMTFDANIDGTTLDGTTVVVSGSQTGLIAGTFSGGGTTTITFNPTNDFFAGEQVDVTITQQLLNETGGALATPYHFTFTTASAVSPENPTTFIANIISSSADGVSSVYAADIDGDGDMDVLSASQYNDRITWFENDGNGLNPTFTTHDISTTANGAFDVYAADVDGDGDMDVLSASLIDDRIAWYENDGNESFTTHDISTTADGVRGVYAADIDGDGDMDVLSASFIDDRIAWYENDGNESFITHDISTTADAASSVYAADIDGDGDMDVLSASQTDDRITWFENDGNGLNPTFTTHDISTTANGAFDVYAADVDGDGDMDVLSASLGDDRIAWYENDGSESFTTHDISTTADGAYSVHAVDVDGDGDMDVLSASQYNDRITWFENDGNGLNPTFTTHDISTTANGAFDVYAADVDGDGDMDVLSASFYSDRIDWYKNADVTSPTVTLTSTASDPTNTAAIPVTITFSESVTGFELADIAITNGTGSGFTDNGDGSYDVTVTATSDGLVLVDIEADAAVDIANNGNIISPPFGIVYDATSPTVNIASVSSSHTNTVIPVMITFSEPVMGFELADIAITNGTGSGFTDNGDGSYDVTVTATSDGVVSMNIPADVSTDAAGNSNTAALVYEITFDSTAPTVTLTSTSSDPTNTAVIPVTITFSEAVIGFERADIEITNSGIGSNFTDNGDGSYDVTLGALAEGLVTVNIPANVSTDLAGNSNTASLPFEITFDGTAPTVAITTTASDPTNTAAIPVTITFSESVTGFELADIAITNGTGSGFTDNGNGSYDVTVTATADGAVSVNIPADVSTDAAGNGNEAASSFEIMYIFINQSPQVVAAIPNQSLTITGTTGENATFTLSEYFTDPDGDELVYAAQSDDETIATAEIVSESETLTVTAIAEGTSQVTVTADDQLGGQVSSNFDVTVVFVLSASSKEIVEILYYPNPATTDLTIKSDVFRISEWKLYGLSGDLRKEGAGSGKNELTINVQGMAVGTYVLKLLSLEGETVDLRVRVNK
ncbi:FG-GAP-like repeat-containing protein [Ekhidna sp. To15]|uniref:FG-GAP-like repeat-containing protein n=1 Tax=Ekhidna sp. To15 TaxID=3395267 RepID=UPI003F525C6C